MLLAGLTGHASIRRHAVLLTSSANPAASERCSSCTRHFLALTRRIAEYACNRWEYCHTSQIVIA